MNTTNYDTSFFNCEVDTPVIINNWALVKRPHPFRAPELIPLSVEGIRSTDGKLITTSPIVRRENGCVYTQSGSCYKLGTVNSVYAKRFPQYKEWI